MSRYTILGLDVGGKTKVVKFYGNDKGEMWYAESYQETDSIPSVVTPKDVSADQFVSLLETAIREADLYSNVDLVGYSICGPVVGNRCLRLINRNILESFEITVSAVLNDAMAATIGSRLAGVAKGHEGALALLTLGTGIGVGSFHWASKDQLVMNDGESHMTVRGSNRKCGCKRMGCFEAAANESGLKSYAIYCGANAVDIASDLGRSLEKFLAQEETPTWVLRAMNIWYGFLAQGIANLYAVLDMGGNEHQPPAMFVLGGGLSQIVDEKEVERQVLKEFDDDPLVGKRFSVRREGKVGNRAGVIGAAAMALANKLEYDITKIKFVE